MSVRHALLALLSEGPKYGLQLRHEFEERTGEVWPLNVGTLSRGAVAFTSWKKKVGERLTFSITPSVALRSVALKTLKGPTVGS